ncbi:MAG: hypothetical protein N2255_01650 [Kiritimatiellae bacterium]|nr:hypothetical protein [Kiritimatiellia bacterium]
MRVTWFVAALSGTLILGGVLVGLGVENPPLKYILLVNAGAVGEKMAERLRSFAQNELDVPVRLVSVPDPKVKTLHDAGKPLFGAKGTNDVILIGLVVPDAEIPMHMAMLPDIKVAVVNAKALRHADEETYARRLERQVMRSAAFLLGLRSCPEPRDVTYNYRSIEELDKIGRNFSAPWRRDFQKAAEAAGLRPPVSPHPPGQQQAPSSRSEEKK